MEVDVQVCTLEEFTLGISSNIGEDDFGLEFNIIIIGFFFFQIVITYPIILII